MEHTEKYNQWGWKGPSLKICIKKNKINKNKNRNKTLLVQTSLSGLMDRVIGPAVTGFSELDFSIHVQVVHECQHCQDRDSTFIGPKELLYLR